ncbi:hypothetical protein Hanom_Chr09g00807101 [Helianthus anomalus]
MPPQIFDSPSGTFRPHLLGSKYHLESMIQNLLLNHPTRTRTELLNPKHHSV